MCGDRISYKLAALLLKMSLRGARRQSNLHYCGKNKDCFTTFAMTSALKIALILLICNFALANKIIYVDDDVAGANDGSSWQNAYNYLQDALADAKIAEKPVEIRVAQGIYKPDQGAGQTAGDRNTAFQLINDTALSGGYAGIFEPDPNERNIEKYETILSGDLVENDLDELDLDKLFDDPTREENSIYVVQNNSETVIDGFKITAGNGYNENSGFYWGGGLRSNGKLQVLNCTFTRNSGSRGTLTNEGGIMTLTNCDFTSNNGGIFSFGNDLKKLKVINSAFTNNIANEGAAINGWDILVTDCVFVNNSARYGGAINGRSGISVSGCVFMNNSARYGGAIYTEGLSTVNNCVFKKNSASYDGGGISFYMGIYSMSGGISFFGDQYGTSDGVSTMNKWNIHNCVFEDNSATNNGGAIDIFLISPPEFVEISNCTIVNNSAANGKAIAFILDSEQNALINNSIIRNGTDAIRIFYNSGLEINYCNIQNGQDSVSEPEGGLVWGAGNIDVDPLFADPNNNDYHLKSQAGRFDPDTQRWVQDDVTSPCIDAGDPNSPIGYEPFPINMGAYGGTSEASKSYFGEPVCETIVAGDINGDCKVDQTDLDILMLHWLEEH